MHCQMLKDTKKPEVVMNNDLLNNDHIMSDNHCFIQKVNKHSILSIYTVQRNQGKYVTICGKGGELI